MAKQRKELLVEDVKRNMIKFYEYIRNKRMKKKSADLLLTRQGEQIMVDEENDEMLSSHQASVFIKKR